MSVPEDLIERMRGIEGLTVSSAEPLSRHTRFSIGGPAAVFIEADSVEALLAAVELIRSHDLPLVVVGGGTNLVVADEGFPGGVLRFTGRRIAPSGRRIVAEAGAALDDLVECAVENGLEGIETLAGIPGTVGGAVYGNAGAYGHSISERVSLVRFIDGARVREIGREECEFAYRDSVFKRRKDWIVFEVEVELTPAPREVLRATAGRIVETRNRKFPPQMKCAGSVFKNLLLPELPEAVASLVPPEVVREGKIPAAWFLEQAGAKGMARGDIRIADYHANLIYNAGTGTARDLRELIADVKSRVQARFRLELEEEVQYIGFGDVRQERVVFVNTP